MDTATQILVIITSSVLVILLILLITVAIYAIKVIKQVRRVATKAETMVNSVESAADLLGKSASPIGMIKLIARIVEQVTKASNNRR